MQTLLDGWGLSDQPGQLEGGFRSTSVRDGMERWLCDSQDLSGHYQGAN